MPQYHAVTKPGDDAIWLLLISHAGQTFHTARGLPFSYQQKISRTGEPLGELIIDRKEKTITRNTVLLAYEKAVELMETGRLCNRVQKTGMLRSELSVSCFSGTGNL